MNAVAGSTDLAALYGHWESLVGGSGSVEGTGASEGHSMGRAGARVPPSTR